MGILELLGAVLCAGVGAFVALYVGRRLGVLAPLLMGMAAQGLITLGLYVAVGLWSPDAVHYDTMARQLASSWHGGPDPSLAIGGGKEGFPALLAVLYFAFGANPISGLALNWSAHALLIVVVAATARKLGLPVVLSAWIIALFPPALLWGGLLLREALTWLLLALLVLSVISFARAESRREYLASGALFAGSLTLLMWVRGTAAIIVGVGVVLVLLVTAKRRDLAPRFALGVVLVLLLLPRVGAVTETYVGVPTAPVVVGVPLAPAFGPDLSDGRTRGPLFAPEDEVAPDDRLATIRDSLARDSTSSFGPAESNRGLALLDTGARVLGGPFPWEWHRISPGLVVDGLGWLVLLVAAIVGTWRHRDKLRLLALVWVPAGLLLGALVLTSGNYGTMQRLRVQSAVLMVPLAAAGLEMSRSRARSSRGERPEGVSTVVPEGEPGAQS